MSAPNPLVCEICRTAGQTISVKYDDVSWTYLCRRCADRQEEIKKLQVTKRKRVEQMDLPFQDPGE